MRGTRMDVPIKELTSERFAPYGQVIERPAAAPDAAGSGWQ